MTGNPMIEDMKAACRGVVELERLKSSDFLPPASSGERQERERWTAEYHKMVRRFPGILTSGALSEYMEEREIERLVDIDPEDFSTWLEELEPGIFIFSSPMRGGKFCHLSYALLLPSGKMDRKRRALCGELSPFPCGTKFFDASGYADRKIEDTLKESGMVLCKACRKALDDRDYYPAVGRNSHSAKEPRRKTA